jgi:hypothetical protein
VRPGTFRTGRMPRPARDAPSSHLTVSGVFVVVPHRPFALEGEIGGEIGDRPRFPEVLRAICLKQSSMFCFTVRSGPVRAAVSGTTFPFPRTYPRLFPVGGRPRATRRAVPAVCGPCETTRRGPSGKKGGEKAPGSNATSWTTGPYARFEVSSGHGAGGPHNTRSPIRYRSSTPLSSRSLAGATRR